LTVAIAMHMCPPYKYSMAVSDVRHI